MRAALRRFAPERVKSWYRRVARRREYTAEKEIDRLTALGRYTRTTTTLLGRPLTLVDSASFLAQYKVIFQRERYRFTAKRPDPVILDCGANIGLMTLYWKRTYPPARVTAFEPDPAAFQALAANVASFGLADVELVQRAVWTCAGELPFWIEGGDAGRLILRTDDPSEPRRTVQTVRLRDYLDADIDMLKLDIEGSEVDVVLDCADHLRNVGNVLIEYHSFHGHKQRVDELLHALLAADFRLHILPDTVSRQPFLVRQDNMGMDLQLEIFGYRV
jgi:FkbM family methyltransferase